MAPDWTERQAMADMHNVVRKIAAMRDPVERLRTLTQQLVLSQREVNELARLRRETIQEMHDAGMSYTQIADAVGVTRGRIHQIKLGAPPPEAAFFGPGPLTIVTPLKREAIRSRPVVAVEDVAGAQRLADYARSMKIESTFEHIPVDGDVDLNRDGLVVICGPRISKAVAQVLKEDRTHTFRRAEDRVWTLVDRSTGAVYRSGSDEEPPRSWDVAYLGRLARPDGNGSFLIFTGIHPTGSLGVVELLRTRLADLYAHAKTDLFSALVGTTFDPVTNEPRSVELLTDIRPIVGNA